MDKSSLEDCSQSAMAAGVTIEHPTNGNQGESGSTGKTSEK